MFAFHLFREIETDILYRHGELLFFIHRKAESAHFAGVIVVSLKVKDARTFTVVEKAFAVDLAGVATDGEVNVLAAGLREIDALKGTRGPVRFVVGLAAVMAFDERELNLAGRVGFADSPVAAANFGGTVLDNKKHYAGCEDEVGEGTASSHGVLLLGKIRSKSFLVTDGLRLLLHTSGSARRSPDWTAEAAVPT